MFVRPQGASNANNGYWKILNVGDHSGASIDVLNASNAVYPRLQRTCDFYRVHLPAHQFPGERMLQEKLPLWMGRISPPRLSESPTARLERLNVAEVLLTHLKLVLAFMRRGGLDR